MSSVTPPNFVDLNSALSRQNVEINIMGTVTDFLAPGRSRGTDWMCSFSIKDPSYGGLCDEGLKIRFFRPTENDLPAIKGTGDVVLLRGIKIKEWSGMKIGLSTRTTSWTVFPAASIPATPLPTASHLSNVKGPRAPAPTFPEMQYAISLCNSCDRSTFTEPAPAPYSSSSPPSPNRALFGTMPRREKFSLIKDLQIQTYYDLIGQVVKLYPSNGCVELYITDYTENRLLFNHEWGQDDVNESGREGDEFNYAPGKSADRSWNGPPGYRTLTVTLFPPHSYFGQQNLTENTFVHLRNVHIKWSKDSKMEGVLHSDRRYPDRVDITVLQNNADDDRVKDVLRRKRDLARKFSAQRDDFVAQAQAQKRKGRGDGKPISKQQARKRRRLEKERGVKTRTEDTKDGDDKENQASNASISLEDQLDDITTPLKAQKQDLNSNIHCSHHLITPRPLSSILSLDSHVNTTPDGTLYSLPFQNIKVRATVRIIDFFPYDLADFAVPCPKSSEYDILSDREDSESGNDSEDSTEEAENKVENGRRWEWRFGLVLEDAFGPKKEAKATMEVYVAGQDAEFLLKLDAEDLRKSSIALAALREKLFLLWGNLEEQKARKSSTLRQIDANSHSPRKEEAPQNRPFQCCLKEYGVKKSIERSVEEEESDSGNEGGSESEDRSKRKSANVKSKWIWERKWRMFGCTII